MASQQLIDWLDEQESAGGITNNFDTEDKTEAVLAVLNKAEHTGIGKPVEPADTGAPPGGLQPVDPNVPNAPPADGAAPDGGADAPVPVAPGAGDGP